MTRIKLLFILILSLSIFSCAKDSTTDPAVTKTDAIKSTEWIVDGFTLADNTPIDPALFAGDAKFINQLTYIFENTGIVRSYDKISKQPASYGTWGLSENDTKLDINIQGFKGTFGVIELSKQKMILRNNIKYNNTEIPVNMVFLPLK
ncbi:hypothetical protein VB796_00305 [Arcicella sp. LKC2W]|uniref:hypothetical protein n=1 Tax=Arcicella sp. LKC2W TaxID=2984198 RepID=UPI002B1FCD56|nr:hypothetical protein [Arcicella sp. LKC2W]MEA5457458.1 hypothetical protein [Arcicella sp. LKC2W]